MTVIDTNDKTNNATNEGVRSTVSNMKVSWIVLSVDTERQRAREFVPRAAGRRAAAKHADALRRLSA
jgi:hypothetical protein